MLLLSRSSTPPTKMHTKPVSALSVSGNVLHTTEDLTLTPVGDVEMRFCLLRINIAV